MNSSETVNAMTIDVEDYFHVAALSESIDREDWDGIAPRVEQNTRRLLDLFGEAGVRCTFFMLGWVAERYPALVREILAGRHELACHGFSHRLIYEQEPGTFREETARAKAVLEQTGGVAVRGYRAASYSITARSLWALDIIGELGFDYDSSIVPARHDLYGIASAPSNPYVIELANGRPLTEFPPSTVSLAGLRVPIGGGGYFRIFPYAFSRWGMRSVNRSGHPVSFYLHPWEIDPDQPRVDVGFKSRFRHYHNLDKFEPRLRRLLGDFRFAPMCEVLDALSLDSVTAASLAVAADGAA